MTDTHISIAEGGGFRTACNPAVHDASDATYHRTCYRTSYSTLHSCQAIPDDTSITGIRLLQTMSGPPLPPSSGDRSRLDGDDHPCPPPAKAVTDSRDYKRPLSLIQSLTVFRAVS